MIKTSSVSAYISGRSAHVEPYNRSASGQVESCESVAYDTPCRPTQNCAGTSEVVNVSQAAVALHEQHVNIAETFVETQTERLQISGGEVS
jgi:hypothetical protein